MIHEVETQIRYSVRVLRTILEITVLRDCIRKIYTVEQACEKKSVKKISHKLFRSSSDKDARTDAVSAIVEGTEATIKNQGKRRKL